MRRFVAPTDPRFTEVQFLIEATRNEQITLWERWHKTWEWKEDLQGICHQVGFLNDGTENRPVMIEFTFAHLNGVRVLFYECPSMVCHWDWLRDYAEKACPNSKGHCNADNFHQCTRHVDRVNKV